MNITARDAFFHISASQESWSAKTFVFIRHVKCGMSSIKSFFILIILWDCDWVNQMVIVLLLAISCGFICEGVEEISNRVIKVLSPTVSSKYVSIVHIVPILALSF